MNYYARTILRSVTFLIVMITLKPAYATESFILCPLLSDEPCIAWGNDLDKPLSPASTFKIPLALMGFDAGILQNEYEPEWPYREEYTTFLPSWRAPHTPATWMKNSCLWFSQVLTPQLGIDRIQAYLEAFDYGNKDFSGDVGKNNGLTHAWLNSSLKISMCDQIRFLRKLVLDQLPVSAHALTMTRAILFIDQLEHGWKLSGKTGHMVHKGAQDGRLDYTTGWFIGWIQKDDECYLFAYTISDKVVDLSRRVPHVKELLKRYDMLTTN